MPNPGLPPRFLQLYFIEPEEAQKARENTDIFTRGGCDKEMVEHLDTILRAENPYARDLMRAHQYYEVKSL